MFSSMLDGVRWGCLAQETVRALKERTLVVDKFQASGQSPLCLIPTRQSCQDFNSEMLTKLDSELKDIKCVDEVDETKGTFKWSKKTTKAMEKLNRDGLEAVLKVAVRARVMLRRNIDTRSGLVNGALGTVTAIRTHHVTVQFDCRQRFLVLKNIYVQRKQFPLILAFSVTCQGLSLDCRHGPVQAGVLCWHGIRSTVTCEADAEAALHCFRCGSNQGKQQESRRAQPLEADIPARFATLCCAATREKERVTETEAKDEWHCR